MSRCRKCDPVPEEVRRLADLLARRWLLSILFAAVSGALRFNEFADAVEGISPRMLAERLRDLEAAGLIERVVISSSPPMVEYRLTPRGRALAPVLDAVRSCAATTPA
jgi:DNA-binding HxlR family transcriptional regulator